MLDWGECLLVKLPERGPLTPPHSLSPAANHCMHIYTTHMRVFSTSLTPNCHWTWIPHCLIPGTTVKINDNQHSHSYPEPFAFKVKDEFSSVLPLLPKVQLVVAAGPAAGQLGDVWGWKNVGLITQFMQSLLYSYTNYDGTETEAVIGIISKYASTDAKCLAVATTTPQLQSITWDAMLHNE